MLKSLFPLLLLPFLAACGKANTQDANPSLCVQAALATTESAEASILSTSADTGVLAQSIIPDAETRLTGFELHLKKLGSPSGLLTLTLEKNSGEGEAEDTSDTASSSPKNTPDGVALATAALYVSEVEGQSFEPYLFSFGKTVTLDANQMYWLRLEATYGSSKENLVSWGASTGKLTWKADTTEAIYETNTTQLWKLFSTVGAARRDFLYQAVCAD